MPKESTKLPKLYEVLAGIREEAGLTMRDLAVRIGIQSHVHILEIERGSARPSFELIKRYADAFPDLCDLEFMQKLLILEKVPDDQKAGVKRFLFG